MRYSVEILKDKEFHYTKYKNHRRGIIVQDRKDTAIVKIEYDNGEKATLEYGYIDVEEVYEMIRNNVEINLNRTYIKNFKFSKAEISSKRILGFSAYYAFFDGDTDFSSAEFNDGDVNFSHIIFGNGDVSFYQTNFGDGDVYFHKSNFGKGNVDFYSASFGNGNVDFKFTTFGKGHIDFNNTSFGDGDVFFNGSHFGEGDVFFRGTTFGNGHVDFHSTSFEKGNIYFNNASFGDGNVDFYHTSFGEGYVDFDNANFGIGKVDFKQVSFDKGDVNFSNITFKRGNVNFSNITFGEGNVNFGYMMFNEGTVDFNNTFFGNGNVDFSGTIFKNGNVIFTNTKFGNGEINFSKIGFGEEKVDFSDISFGTGKLSFENSSAKYLVFDNCIFNDYCDMRLAVCESLSLNNCTFKDVFDMQKDEKDEVKINSICIINSKNLGQIYLDWNANNVKNMICKQKHIDERGKEHETNNKQKLEQFRLLKENFHNLGRYEDEDKAYVEFKRYERIEDYNFEGLDKGKSLSLKRLIYIKTRIVKFIINLLDLVVLEKIGRYGTCPQNIFKTMLATIVFFTGIYTIFPSMLDLNTNCRIAGTIPRAFYLSVETFLTIGYGNISPANNYSIVLAAIEGFMGVFLMSYFTVAFVRKILR
jgi:hypothetical protein